MVDVVLPQEGVDVARFVCRSDRGGGRGHRARMAGGGGANAMSGACGG